MIDKKAAPTKLLWLDLELTGLDPSQDVILEVAVEVTDFNFKKLSSYEAIIKQPTELVVERMQKNDWWDSYPENRDEFVRKVKDGKPGEQVEAELIDLVREHFGDEPAVLAGNSIHNDRNFIKQWWPLLDATLHYRMLDVSAWKVFMQGRYGLQLQKREVHRAYDDIHDSMSELQHYLEYFRNGSQDG